MAFRSHEIVAFTIGQKYNMRGHIMETRMAPRILFTLTPDQALALRDALEFYARISMGQLQVLSEKVREGIIPVRRESSEPRALASPESCEAIDDLMFQVKQVLGYPGAGSMSIGHQHVHVSGHRAWEMYKVIAQALALRADPNPPFRGVHYDGLSLRYTRDPAPVASVLEAGEAVS